MAKAGISAARCRGRKNRGCFRKWPRRTWSRSGTRGPRPLEDRYHAGERPHQSGTGNRGGTQPEDRTHKRTGTTSEKDHTRAGPAARTGGSRRPAPTRGPATRRRRTTPDQHQGTGADRNGGADAGRIAAAIEKIGAPKLRQPGGRDHLPTAPEGFYARGIVS